MRLKEIPMPDLDQIKQGEQGARDLRERPSEGGSGNPAARLLFAGEGEALTCKPVEPALATSIPAAK